MRHLIYCLTCLVLISLAACRDDILTDAGSQPTCQLNDSDGYNLGILLTGHQTATQRMMLYNPHSGELALTSISLRGGDSSIFRINVDGMAGTNFTNSDLLHIASGDSLCILLEAVFLGRQEEREVLREDYIDILCNGRQTSIKLKVTTRDVEELRDCTIARDTLWAAGGLDKFIYGQLVIPEHVTLTIGEGMTLYLYDHASVEVYGTLQLQGSQSAPVRLIGSRTDRIFDNLYYRDMSAQWGGINIYPGSMGNLFHYAEIRGMTTGIRLSQEATDTQFLSEAEPGQYLIEDPKRYAYGPDFLSDERQQLIIRHSLVQNSDSSLIRAQRSNMIVENSCLMNSAGALLELNGGAYDVTHCTLANYNFWAAFSKADVVMTNYAPEVLPLDQRTDERDSLIMMPAPLYRCNFTNTIIYGRSGIVPNVDADYAHFVDEAGAPIDSIFAYRLDHCLLQSPTGYDDEDCISCLWDSDPMYLLIDLPNYTVDPHLQPQSPCIGYGEPRTVSRLPLDRDGHPRSATPSIGCYEQSEK